MRLTLQLVVTLQLMRELFSIQCYDCIRDHKIHPKACPGKLLNYPKSQACRISTLGDGKIVEQTVTPVELCDIKDIKMFKLRIAQKYRVGDGQVSCCYTDGCNQNIETARASLINKDVPSPAQTLQAFKLQPLLQGDADTKLDSSASSLKLFWIVVITNLLTILLSLHLY